MMKTYRFDESGHILWSEQVDENTHKSGVIWKEQTKTREVSPAEYDEDGHETKSAELEEYSPYQELIDSGVDIEPYDPDGKIAAEQARQSAKAERDARLQDMTYTTASGAVIQCRPQDEQNMRGAIDRMGRAGITERPWIAADNTTTVVTVSDLQGAIAAGQDQADAIFADYIEVL